MSFEKNIYAIDVVDMPNGWVKAAEISHSYMYAIGMSFVFGNGVK